MGWWYHIVTLEPDAKAERRRVIGQYGLYSQLSVLIPILAYQIYRLVLWLCARQRKPSVAYSAIGEPTAGLGSSGGSLGTAEARWRYAQWWLDGEIAPNWGLRKRWIAGGAWTLWMLILCFSQTGHGECIISHRNMDNSLIRDRLSPSYEADWESCGSAITHPLSFVNTHSLFAVDIPSGNFTRELDSLAPSLWANPHGFICSSWFLVSQLLCSKGRHIQTPAVYTSNYWLDGS